MFATKPQTIYINLLTPLHCFNLTPLAKCKGSVVPVHAVTLYGDSSSTAPLILNLGTRWRWTLHVPATLPLGKEPPAPVTLVAVETPHPVWTYRRTGNPPAPVRNSFTPCQLCSPSLPTMSSALPAATRSSYKIKMCKNLQKKNHVGKQTTDAICHSYTKTSRCTEHKERQSATRNVQS